ncbi:DUF2069 domain-containing protein [Glaciecola sp. 1036]|uniref:DUF2069 domain-containing protein n=1 Tax=Alteromonadaceae TaxID=72275 RepID=UPI003CFE40D8
MTPMSDKVKRFRWLALTSHFLLLLWMSIWYYLLDAGNDYSAGFIFVLFILPLLLPLKGIIAAKPYTHAWACFIVLWYFLHAITTLYAEPEQRLWATIELILASAMFAGCSLFARHRGQELGTGLQKLSKVMKDEKAYFERKGN